MSDVQKAIPSRSYACRNVRGKSLCIKELLHRIGILKVNKYMVVGVILDMGNAYNCINISKMMNLLRGMHLSSVLTKWMIA